MALQFAVDLTQHSSFGQLFTHVLVQRSAVCIGLYRPTVHLGQAFSYVYTNPPPDTVLVEGDRAIVLQPLSADTQRLPADACGIPRAAAGDATRRDSNAMANVVLAALMQQRASRQSDTAEG